MRARRFLTRDCQVRLSPLLLGAPLQLDHEQGSVARRLRLQVRLSPHSRIHVYRSDLHPHSAAGSDTLLQTPPGSHVSLIQYRLVGGILDLYFFSGPSPQSVVQQYGALIGLPTWQPMWGIGFHLCRWGYSSVNATKESAQAMRDAGVPLETMWNDIDVYHAYRDFTTDPVNFPADEMKAFIAELVRFVPSVLPFSFWESAVVEGCAELMLVFRRPRTTSITSRSSTLASLIK